MCVLWRVTICASGDGHQVFPAPFGSRTVGFGHWRVQWLRRVADQVFFDKNIDAWDMGPLGEPMAANRLGAGRLLFPIGWRENFGYKSLQRCGSGVPWGAWLERL